VPILESDLKEYMSANPDSDGGAKDLAREITSGVANNLFPNVSAAQAAAGGTDYRKVFRRNEHGSLDWQAARTWIERQPQGATLSLGLGVDHADDDDPLQGNMTPFSASAVVEAVSDGADTRDFTAVGEDATGDYLEETVALTGTTPVETTAAFAKVYACRVSAVDASRTVEVRQGASGPARGTIGPDKLACFLWRTGAEVASFEGGLRHGDIAPSGVVGLWYRRVWPAGALAVSSVSAFVVSRGGTDA
jgi:hypothetical protein